MKEIETIEDVLNMNSTRTNTEKIIKDGAMKLCEENFKVGLPWVYVDSFCGDGEVIFEYPGPVKKLYKMRGEKLIFIREIL